MAGVKSATKNAWRRAQKKAKRDNPQSEAGGSPRHRKSPTPEATTDNGDSAVQAADLITIDDYDVDDPLYETYKDVFQKFQQPTEEEAAKEVEQPEVMFELDDIPDEEEQTGKQLSKRARKELNTLSIAQLKSLVKKPDLVEWTDISSPDPRLLVAIKGQKNVVPVPSHWSLKREYLSSKRGIEKSGFTLPKFIQETGIMEMREAVIEKQAEMTLKQKQRERVQGKMGKLDIDYSKLYDAFFRRQTKPEMTGYGEVYYEGKEYETNVVHLRPGELSDDLKEALAMKPGHPPPWLINQQRCGPPPSYPNLRIPGVNAPIPPGAAWGFAPGQWGKPPVDDHGHPLFGGDIYGASVLEEQVVSTQHGEPVERATWGTLRAEGESEDEEEEEDDDEEEGEEEQEGDMDTTGIRTSMTGVASALPSEIGGTETLGGEFTLRKQRKGIETEEPGAAPRSAFQILPEKSIESTGFFGGEYAYDLDAARRDTLGADNRRKRKAGDVEMSVDVDTLADNDKLDKDVLRKQYEAQKKAEMQGQWQSIDQDDMNDMIAAESRKRMKREDDKRNRR
ncbi:splicing factor 3b [Massariosphaeria phaeospora]|uniref:Splicing factor 3b n=1 Tax=Massariosphaeria phaeospora TaxID=100035 RepID=A0A7C8MYU3_9PLEO|nr:splicing factor 3b [Massariosphaeria phaeospora]